MSRQGDNAEEHALNNLGESLTSLTGQLLARPSQAASDEVRSRLAVHLGHDPHPHLTSWFTFASRLALRQIYLGLEALDVQGTIQFAETHADTTFENRHGLMETRGSTRRTGWIPYNELDCVAIHVDHGGGAIALSPTTMDGEEPKVVALGEGDIYFYYPPSLEGPDELPEPPRLNHETLPTLTEWIRYLVEHLNSGHIQFGTDGGRPELTYRTPKG